MTSGPHPGRFEGQTVIVAGASGGIGAATALRIAADGGAVVVHYHSRKAKAEDLVAEIRAKSGTAIAVQGDFADPRTSERLVEEALAQFGALDAFVSTVGVTNRMVPFLELTDELLDHTIDVELRSTIRVTRAVLRPLLEQGEGRIVLVGSESGKVGCPGESASASCRGALITFAKSIAREMAPHGITINVVCPGAVDTDLYREMLGRPDFSGKVASSVLRNTPMKRAGTPEELANVVAFLASREASYITGQAISVSGGLTLN